MKWYQVDSNTPNDPKIKALLRHGLAEGGPARARDLVGQVFLLWCYIANHGEAQPGLGVKADGSPLRLDEMADECLVTVEELRQLLTLLEDKRLIDPAHWARGIVFLPGMLKRADTYAKRKGRTVEGSNSVRTFHPDLPLQDKTIQNNTEDQKHRGSADPPSPLPDLLADAGIGQVDALVKLWNTQRNPGPKVGQLNPQRRGLFGRALRAVPDLNTWRTVIDYLNREPWCNAKGGGDHPNWRATLDWLAKPGKLAEYLDRAVASRQPVRADGTAGRNAAKGRTGYKPGEFAEALKGGDDAVH